MTLWDVEAYVLAVKFGEMVWEEVHGWDKFAKWSIGQQFTRAADSIGANIAEGFGRHFKKDKKNFYRYSRGSAKESEHWLQRSRKRNLIKPEKYQEMMSLLDQMPKAINSLIKYTEDKFKE